MKKRIIVVPLLTASVAALACTAGPATSEPVEGDGDIVIGDGDTPGDGDGDIVIGDGDVPPAPVDEDNLLGIPTNVILTPECASDCTGFTNAATDTPLVVTEGTVDQASLDSGGTPDGICVAEPASGTIFPAAWTRPRFHVPGASGPGKVTLTTPKMKHPFTMYVESMPAILPLDVWEALSRNVHNEDITYTVVTGGGQATGTFQIAPVAAGGSMVFWGSTGTKPGEQTNALYGFGVGDEGVVRVVYPGDIAGTALDDNANARNRDNTEVGKSTCVGCHSSSPDGGAVASMDHWAFNTRVYSIEPGTAGEAPEWLTPAGAAMASMTWLGAPTFSQGDWASNARRMITTWAVRDFSNYQDGRTHSGEVLSNAPTELIWMNLASTAPMPVDIRTVEPAEYTNNNQELQKALVALKGTDWDVIPRTGDTNYPVLADWNHAGDRIVYTSTDVPQDGRVGGATVVDLYTLPFNGGAGGEATPVDGAATGDFEYYPDYSPDDALLAFNKVPAFATVNIREDSWDHVYYRPDSDIHVIPSAGGTAQNLASNSAVCEGTPGQLYNSWAKWSPSFASDGSRTYYFLIFSTARNSPYDLPRGNTRTSPASQLYITTVIKEADGSVTSGAAIYLWNQRNLVEGEGASAAITELLTNNVTPAWDQFKIPPVPPVVVR
jgi:hypothetical protein